MSRLANGKLPKDRPIREVVSLFPQTKVRPTEEQVAEYRSHLPYAFAIDRQSDKKEMARAQATGCRRRVDAIVLAAKDRHLYLPTPVPNEEQQDGELPFFYDDRYWFVDGEHKKATGYAASENARPRLWQAFRLAQALAEQGIGPSFFIIGEATRFFRNDQWLTTFVRALWEHDIKIFVSQFGEVNQANLNGLTSYVTALSGWLPLVTKGARDQRRQQKKLFSNQPPYGLRFTGPEGSLECNDRSEVWTEPDQWWVIDELLRRMADGELSNAIDAAIWLKEVHGVERAAKWVRDLVRHPMLYGEYHAYSRRWEPRKLRQLDGLHTDLDIRDNGTQRYLVHSQEGLHFEIRYTEGTGPIPPQVAMQALSRIERRRGRPQTSPKHKDSILPQGVARCAVCGCSIREFPPRAKEGTIWRLKCRCVEHYRVVMDMSMSESREWIAAHKPHVLALHASLSEALWALMVERLYGEPSPVETPAPDVRHLIETARHRLAAAEAEFDAFQGRCFRGEAGDVTHPRVKASIEKERERLLQTLGRREAELKEQVETKVATQQEQAVRQQIAKVISMFQQFGMDPAVRRDFFSQILDRIDVHLEEGWFRVHIRTALPGLQDLVGRLQAGEGPVVPGERAEKDVGCLTNFFFELVLPGTLVARPPLR
jgi:hypothetical protein